MILGMSVASQFYLLACAGFFCICFAGLIAGTLIGQRQRSRPLPRVLIWSLVVGATLAIASLLLTWSPYSNNIKSLRSDATRDLMAKYAISNVSISPKGSYVEFVMKDASSKTYNCNSDLKQVGKHYDFGQQVYCRGFVKVPLRKK